MKLLIFSILLILVGTSTVFAEEITANVVSEEKMMMGDSSLSPKKQIATGIDPHNVMCKEGLELIFKNSNFQPACVKSSSVAKLIERGWASEHNPHHEG